jgi:hypothetical protein
MNFRDYLAKRINRAGPDALHLIQLHALPGMPEQPQGWLELRDWLATTTMAGPDEMAFAEAVWRAYRHWLTYRRVELPTRPPRPLKPLSPPPGGSGVVTDAEPLTRLRDLGYQPRKIARQIDPATWEWFGDLNDIVERRKYLIMLWDHGSVTQLTHFPDERRMPVLFARVRRPVVPADAYKAASVPVEWSLKQHPRWLAERRPHVGLGAIR